MATPEEQSQFLRNIREIAELVTERVPALLPETFMTQSADETGWGTSAAYRQHNYAGIQYNGQLLAFRNDVDFANVYARVIRGPQYAPVLSATTVPDQLLQLGLSPWAADHYDEGKTGHPGADLLAIWHGNGSEIEDAWNMADESEPASDQAGGPGPAPAEPVHATAAPQPLAVTVSAAGFKAATVELEPDQAAAG